MRIRRCFPFVWLLLLVCCPTAFSQTLLAQKQSTPTLVSLATNDSSAINEQSQDLSNQERLPQASFKVVIDAPPERVWEAIQARRRSDPTHRNLVSYDGKTAVVKEQFPSAPIVGSTTCTYQETELKPLQEISFRMLNSTRFHRFEGRWHLEPGPKSGTTTLSLTSTLDPGMRFPLWRRIAVGALATDVRETVSEVVHLVHKDKSAQPSR